MANKIEIRVPDIGDFERVPVIEVLVAAGDRIEAEQSLVTLESDKATMEVPSPKTGKLVELKVREGDAVSEGDALGIIEVEDDSADEAGSKDETERYGRESEVGKRESESEARASDDDESSEGTAAAGSSENRSPNGDYDFELVVLGAGPGG